VWGEAVYFASLGVIVYAAFFTLLGHVNVLYVEEPELRRRFGDDYAAYCRRVPRWFPGWS
jgi:protein-S-isoprenylcysteine O-methyltransferase Ste14